MVKLIVKYRVKYFGSPADEPKATIFSFYGEDATVDNIHDKLHENHGIGNCYIEILDIRQIVEHAEKCELKPKGIIEGNYIIGISMKSLFIGYGKLGERNFGFMEWKDVKEDLKSNGLEIIKFTFSSFDACWFIEVNGNYTGTIEYTPIMIKPTEFDWEKH